MRLLTYSITTLLIAGLAGYRLLLPPVWFDTIGPTANPGLQATATVLSALTSPEAFITIAFGSAVLAYETDHVRAWLHATAGLITAGLIVWGFKELLQVPRPEQAMHSALSYSFPSGHAAVAITAFVYARFHIRRLYPQWWEHVSVLAGMLVLLVLTSRLLLGVHTISDLIGGILVGLIVSHATLHLWPRLVPAAADRHNS